MHKPWSREAYEDNKDMREQRHAGTVVKRDIQGHERTERHA